MLNNTEGSTSGPNPLVSQSGPDTNNKSKFTELVSLSNRSRYSKLPIDQSCEEKKSGSLPSVPVRSRKHPKLEYIIIPGQRNPLEGKPSEGLSSDEALQRLEKYGKNELPEHNIPKWYIFATQLWQPMPIMIWIAAIIEGAIQNFPDMAILFFILFANASVGYYEINRAGNAVGALKRLIKPSVAIVKRDGKFVDVDFASIVPGDVVLLAAGLSVPADCRVNEGEIDVDEAALSGESLPVTKFQGGECKMGSTVVRGEVEGTVQATGQDTFIGRTAKLLGVSWR